MALETATYINQLNVANPVGSDPIASGDDHLRLIKAALKNTFPAITGPLTADQDEINAVPGLITDVADLTTALEELGAAVGTSIKIKQIIQSVYTSSVSNSSNTYVTTNHNITITPSSTSSKILLMQAGQLAQTNEYAPSNNAQSTIFRNASTNLAGSGANFTNSHAGYANSNYGTVSINYLDSPNTTSAVTYGIYIRALGSGANAYYSGTATFIAVEIL